MDLYREDVFPQDEPIPYVLTGLTERPRPTRSRAPWAYRRALLCPKPGGGRRA